MKNQSKSSYNLRKNLHCMKNNTASTTKYETISADYSKITDLAKTEFAEIFKDFENIQIE